jgi:hypothetical protein
VAPSYFGGQIIYHNPAHPESTSCLYPGHVSVSVPYRSHAWSQMLTQFAEAHRDGENLIVRKRATQARAAKIQRRRQEYKSGGTTVLGQYDPVAASLPRKNSSQSLLCGSIESSPDLSLRWGAWGELPEGQGFSPAEIAAPARCSSRAPPSPW